MGLWFRPGRWLTGLVVVLLAAISACSGSSPGSSPSAGGIVRMTFWAWVPNISDAVNLFNSTHKNVQVTLDTIPPGAKGGYAKMLAAVKAGNAPCDAQVEYQEIPTFLLQDALMNIKEWASADQGMFVPWQWNQSVYNGAVYAIPQASGPMALFYRKDVFARDGIKSPPKTWAQYAQDAAIVHARNPKEYITTFPVPDSAWYTALAWQAGTKWFGTSGDRWTVDIANTASEQIAAYWYNLVTKGLVKTENDFISPWYQDLQDGTLVSWISASWGDAILRQNAPGTSGDWAVAPLPQLSSGGFTASNWGGSATAVLKGCPDPQAATEFAAWLNTNPQSINLLVTDGYGWPAIPDVSSIPSITNNPQVFKFYGGQDINAVFQQADQNVSKSWGWIPDVQSAYDSLDTAFAAAADGHGTFSVALSTAQRQTLATLSNAGLKAAAG